MLLCATMAENADFLRDRFDIMLFTSDVKSNLDSIAEIGFDGAEIFLHDAFSFDFEGMHKYADKLGVKVSAYGTILYACKYGVSLVNDDRQKSEDAVKMLCETVKNAGKYGANTGVGGFRGRIGTMDKALFFEKLRKAMLPALRIAEDNGSFIALEAINKDLTDWGFTAADVLEFIDFVGSKALKVHYDLVHGYFEEKDQVEAIKLIGKERLGHVHITDSDRYYPGHKDIDFLPIMQTLKDLDYQYQASFEYMPRPDAYTAAKKGLEYIKGIMEQVR